MRVTAFFVAIVLALSVASGCGGIGKQSDDVRLTASRDAIITDLPVPEGFKMDFERSSYTHMGQTRIGTLVYKGRASAPSIISFYRDNMPISGWIPQRESSEFGSYVLRFEKNGEGAVVKVAPYHFSTDITISLARVTAR